nr:MAG TPA: hypothetical protein [Caudoviricetes sp.]
MKLVVYALRMADRWTISTDCGFIDKASSVTHVKPESWESIADELEEWSEDNRVNGNDEVFFRAGDLAARIRRLADKEDKR